MIDKNILYEKVFSTISKMSLTVDFLNYISFFYYLELTNIFFSTTSKDKSTKLKIYNTIKSLDKIARIQLNVHFLLSYLFIWFFYFYIST